MPLEVIATGLTKKEARLVEQVLISSYTLQNLHNARREIAVGKVRDAMTYVEHTVKLFEGFTEDEYYTFFSIETTSDRVIPKKQLTYIGNIYGEEEREAANILKAFPLSWERSKSNFKIEEVFIDIYLSWTLPELHFEGSSLHRRLKLRE